MVPDRLLRFNDLKARGIVGSRVQLRRIIQRADFPPGIRLGPSTRAWPEAEIAAWLESRRIPSPAPCRRGGVSTLPRRRILFPPLRTMGMAPFPSGQGGLASRPKASWAT